MSLSAMMTSDWQRVLTGELFTFVVGGDEPGNDSPRCFSVHSELVAKASPALNSLINGNLSESLNRVAELPEVDPETFALFSEWLYTHIYRPASKFSKKLTALGLRPCCADFAGSDSPRTGTWPFCSDECGKASGRCPVKPQPCIKCGVSVSWLKNSFGQYKCLLCEARPDCTSSASAWNRTKRNTFSNTSSGSAFYSTPISSPPSYATTKKYPVAGVAHATVALHLKTALPPVSHSDDLVTHAKLYCFAMLYMISPLKELCLHMLDRDIAEFAITSESVSAATELIAYTYDNTSAVFTTGENSYTGGDLRDLVLQFTLDNQEELGKHQEFRDLLFQGGDFVVDLFQGGKKAATSEGRNGGNIFGR